MRGTKFNCDYGEMPLISCDFDQHTEVKTKKEKMANLSIYVHILSDWIEPTVKIGLFE